MSKRRFHTRVPQTKEDKKYLQENDDLEIPSANKDYISLKIAGPAKLKKQEDELDVMEFYSNDKYKEYIDEVIKEKKKPIENNRQLKQFAEFVQNFKNICVFGFGSKIELLKSTYEKYLSGYFVWEIKGYLPTINEKKIYNNFGSVLIEMKLVDKIESVVMADLLQEYKFILLTNPSTRIVAVFHSLDSLTFLNSDSQKKLADLFSLPQIQLICSIDNFKICTVWSPLTLEKYKFHFFNINTSHPYILEQKNRPLLNEKKQKSQSALFFVWQSLNKNQKQILKFIAKNELQNYSRDEKSYYTLNELLEVCIEQIVLSSDSQLRQNLLELLDHKVIEEKVDEKKNKKVYMMKYERRTLEKVMETKID